MRSNSMNESLTVQADDQTLYLTSMFEKVYVVEQNGTTCCCRAEFAQTRESRQRLWRTNPPSFVAQYSGC